MKLPGHPVRPKSSIANSTIRNLIWLHYSGCKLYSEPASRIDTRRLIIRRMNNSPCNLGEVRTSFSGKKESRGGGKGIKAAISRSVTWRCEKLTASPTSRRSLSLSCTSIPIVLSRQKYYFFSLFLSRILCTYIYVCVFFFS